MAGTILCFGDSNTFGYDSRDFFGGRYPKEVRWTDILERKSGRRVLNRGLCGRQIPHTPAQIEPVRLQLKDWRKEAAPVDLWIMLGGNDLMMNPGFTAEDAAARMELLLRDLLEDEAVRSGDIRIRLIAPPAVEYGTWVTEERVYSESRRMDETYRNTARKLKTAFTAAGSWEIPVLFDGVHYSEEGHRKFASYIQRYADAETVISDF